MGNADALALILACATANDASIDYSRYVPQRPAISHRPDGKMLVDMSISILIFDDVCCLDLQQGVRAICAGKIKSSHRPDGKMADMPKSTLIFRFGLIFGSIRDMYVPATPANFPSPRWDFHMFFALCLQGGGVYIGGGTVTFSSCTITGNTAFYVRAHARNFPSPRWEFLLTCPIDSHLSIRIDIWFYQANVRACHACKLPIAPTYLALACACRAAVSLFGVAR